MQLMKTKITELFQIEIPIVLAPMGGVAGGALAAAVTEAGGLGLIGCGYADPETGYGGEWIHQQFDLAAGRRVGAGFITWSLAKHPEALDIALERNADPIFLSFGDVRSFIPRIRSANRKLILQVSAVAEAREAIDLGPDVIVAKGTEAGGHGRMPRTLFTLLPAVVDLAGSIPVLAAGGISDGRGFAAARVLGAEGVLVGTRFFASREALGSEAMKDRIVSAGGDDTLRTRVFDIARGLDWPADYTGRAISNRFSQTWHGREEELSRKAKAVAEDYEAARRKGDLETLALFAGEGIDLVKDHPSATEILRRMVIEADVAFARLGRP
jgi:nitronate monooxygenase